MPVKCLEHEIYAQGFVTKIEEFATYWTDCGRTPQPRKRMQADNECLAKGKVKVLCVVYKVVTESKESKVACKVRKKKLHNRAAI